MLPDVTGGLPFQRYTSGTPGAVFRPQRTQADATQRTQHFRFSLNRFRKLRSLRGVSLRSLRPKTAPHVPRAMHRQGNDRIFITGTTNQPIGKTQKNLLFIIDVVL
jgi:hypothetical protein